MTSEALLHRYARPRSIGAALALLADDPRAAPLAGGTDLVPLTRARLRSVSCVVDLSALNLAQVQMVHSDTLRLGALTTMADASRHPLVRAHAPLLAETLDAGASTQLRHRATLGGNLLQMPRCFWLRSGAPGCNRRNPGSGCDAQAARTPEGERGLSIIGHDASCAAASTSDLAVALHALDAELEIASAQGLRSMPVESLWSRGGHASAPPGASTLAAGELITAVNVPLPSASAEAHHAFEKVRDRASFDFAVVSVAAMLRIESGRIRSARISAGAVAPMPWRLHAVESMLLDRSLTAESIAAASACAAIGMRPFEGNAFKENLLGRVVQRALRTAAGLA